MPALSLKSMNQAQMMILESFAEINDEQETDALMALLRDFYAARLEKEMSRLSDNGTLNEGKLEALRGRHLRIPYRPLAQQ